MQITQNGALHQDLTLASELHCEVHLTGPQREEYEAIDTLKLCAVSIASKKCQKCFVSGVPFCANMILHWNKIET